MKTWRTRFLDSLTAQRVAVILLTVGIVIGIVGYAVQHPEGFTLGDLLGDFYANISTEAFSIAITVLIIDTLNRRREARVETEREREGLMRQLGSTVNEVAKRASEELRARGWLTDGTLQATDLRVANLDDARLWDADLQGVNLQWAKLNKANLNGATLAGANLTQAKLTGAKLNGTDLRGADLREARLYRCGFHDAKLQTADLTGAFLQGARLENADLRGAILTGINMDEHTMLPDSSMWTADADLARFTDPAHPNFWQPAPDSPPQRGTTRPSSDSTD